MEFQWPKVFSVSKSLGAIEVVAGGVGYRDDEWWPFAYYKVHNYRLATISDIPVPVDKSFARDVDAALFAMDFAVNFVNEAGIPDGKHDAS